MLGREGRTWLLALSTALQLTAFGPAARAADGADVRCMASYEDGQRLQRSGKLSAARVALAICREACPTVFRQDCARWATEVEALAPTVQFRVVDEGGRPRADVRVLVDGQLLADPLPAASVPVDPGTRTFRFEKSGFQPVEIRLALQPGERDHRVDVTLASIASHPAPPPLRPPQAAPDRRSRVPSFVLGGVGVGALVASGVLLLKGHVDRAALQDSCAPACDPAASDPIRTMWWVSAAAAGAGALSLGAAFLLWPRETKGPRVSLRASLSGVHLRAELP